MKRAYGFTLVELLVVIAIISILAGIVIPNVPKYINKARAVRAYSEVKSIDLALTKMLTDAGRSDFKSGFFDDSTWPVPSGTGQDAVREQAEVYTTVFYILLRKGKYADADPGWPAGVRINEEVRLKLGSDYMPLGNDPWGDLYQFYAGPFTPPTPGDTYYVQSNRVLTPFRIFQVTSTVPGGIVADALTVQDVVDPDDDAGTQMDLGYPAPRKATQFVWSLGKNRASNQEFNQGYAGPAGDVELDFIGGGDDINNWDGEQSWLTFYN